MESLTEGTPVPDSDAYLPWEDLGSPTFKLSNSLWALVPLEAWRRGLTVQLRPGARYVISGHGVTRSFRQTRLADPSSDQIARFCGDKNATNHVLAEAGVPVPRGMRFHSSDDQRLMLQFAAELGFPVCLKPNAWAKGRGVFPSVPDVEALDQLITHLIDDLESPDLLIEQHIRGENVRVVVAGDRAVAVTLMKAARVVGDGSASIEALVARRNEERKVNPYLGGVPIVVDELVHRHLAAQGLSLASVPERDRIVILTSTANISKGGDPIDITDQVSDSLRRVAVDAIRAIRGLEHGAVDLIVEEPLSAKPKALVNEINPSLGMGPQIYPAHGERRDVVSEFLDHYFPGTSRLPHSEHWHFSLNSVVRQFTSETLDRATLKAMPILKNPQWRSFELVATHPEVTQSRSVAMRSLNASKVHGAIISDSTGRTIVQFVADGTAADAAGAALARALRPLKIRVRETSQEPFKVSPGFSVG